MDELGKLPANLGGLYYAMFSKRFCDMDKYEIEVLPLLDCLVAALHHHLKGFAFGVSKLDQRTTQKGLLILSQYIDKNEVGLRHLHQSLRIGYLITDYAKYAASYPMDTNALLKPAGLLELKAGVQNMSSYAVASRLNTSSCRQGAWIIFLELVF